ncbi:MAG TPA: glycosyltransferase, partial [Bacteroidales bacterium]|nr:glycosyltransferase [Bacteroidales bacterium]
TGAPGTVVKNQANSLHAKGVSISFFLIKKKGLLGYIIYGNKLRSFINNNHFDIIHAHYTLSGWSAVIGSGNIPVVLSLMGSDAHGNMIASNRFTLKSKFLIFLTYIIQPYVKKIISKSANIENIVWAKRKSIIIPNGVNTIKFHPAAVSKQNLGLNEKNIQVLFLGDRNDIGKNYKLAINAFSLLNDLNVELHCPYPISHDQIPEYLNTFDILIHTSFAEGSPNLIKEAMACNMPIVATDVGDISWLFGDEPGHFLTSFEPVDVAEEITQAIEFSKKYGRTKGRDRIIKLGLDSETIADRIIEVYNSVLENGK